MKGNDMKARQKRTEMELCRTEIERMRTSAERRDEREEIDKERRCKNRGKNKWRKDRS